MPRKKPSWDNTIHDLTVHKLPPSKLRQKLKSRKPRNSAVAATTTGHRSHASTNNQEADPSEPTTQRLFYVTNENSPQVPRSIIRKHHRNHDFNHHMKRGYRRDDGEMQEDLMYHSSEERDLHEISYSADADGAYRDEEQEDVSDDWSSHHDDSNEDDNSDDMMPAGRGIRKRRQKTTKRQHSHRRRSSSSSGKSHNRRKKSSKSEFMKLDIQHVNHQKKNTKRKRLIEQSYLNMRQQAEDEETSQEDMPPNHTADATLHSLEKAYESIQSEIEEFEKSRNDSHDLSDLYEDPDSVIQHNHQDTNPSVTNEALEEWRNYKKQQEILSEGERRASSSPANREVLSNNFVARNAAPSPENNTTTRQSQSSISSRSNTAAVLENKVNQLEDELSNQSERYEQLRFEFDQYKRQSENQITELTGEMEKMKELFSEMQRKQAQESYTTRATTLPPSNTGNNHNFTTTERDHEPKAAPASFYRSTGASSEGESTDDEEDSRSIREEDSGDEESYHDNDTETDQYYQEEETLPSMTSQNASHFATQRASSPKQTPASSDVLGSPSLNDSIKQSKPPRKKPHTAKSNVVRPAVPKSSFSFNVLKKPNVTQQKSSSLLPETPQPNRNVPLPSQDSSHMIHNGAPAYTPEKVPPLNSQSSDAGIQSPERQAKVTSKRASNPCPVLSPRPSINKNASASSHFHGGSNNRRKGSQATNTQNASFLMDSSDDEFQPQPVTILGRDRSNLEPKISSNSTRFEIRKFIPNPGKTR